MLFSLPRFGHKLSSSSKKITQGADYFARLNSDLTAFSDSPTYLFSSSGPFIEMKFALDSLETALATRVLPQPGGPYSNTPAGAERPTSLKIYGFLIGSTIDILSSALTWSNAPTSLHVVLGTVENPSLYALGFTNLDACSKSFTSIQNPSRSILASESVPCYPTIALSTAIMLASLQRV